jgi:sugar lactone lactonase YvrE
MAPSTEQQQRNIRCIADVGANVGEGPVWVERDAALYWVDNKGQRVFRLVEDSTLESFDMPLQVCCIAPRASGGFIAGTDKGFAFIDFDGDRIEIIANPEEDIAGNRFNDGKTDAGGRFWAGTMDNAEKETRGSLYRLDRDLSWIKVDGGYHVTNGPAFDPSRGRMYHTDSAPRAIYVFDLADSGDVANKRVFIQFGEADGHPDGMTVDSHGNLWVCFWDGWCIRRISPDGEVTETIDTPVQRPTSCCFGGSDLDKLYVTSASQGIEEDSLAMQPCAGGLFLLEPGARGVAQVPFAG